MSLNVRDAINQLRQKEHRARVAALIQRNTNYYRKQRCCECITMLTVLSVFTAFSMYVVFAYGFYIGQREPFSLLHKEWPYKVKKAEGDTAELMCQADHYWEWCRWIHYERYCDFEWVSNSEDGVITNSCDFKEGKVEIFGNYTQYQCGLRINNLGVEDRGLWMCEIEKYYTGFSRRYGEIRTATFTVVVVLKNSTDNRSSLQVGGPYGGEQRQIEAGNVEDNLSSGERNSAEDSSANESAEQNKAQLSFINEANIFIVPSLSEEGEKDNGQREEEKDESKRKKEDYEKELEDKKKKAIHRNKDNLVARNKTGRYPSMPILIPGDFVYLGNKNEKEVQNSTNSSSTSFDNYDEDIDEDDEDIPFMTDDQKWKSRKEYKRKFFLLKVFILGGISVVMLALVVIFWTYFMYLWRSWDNQGKKEDDNNGDPTYEELYGDLATGPDDYLLNHHAIQQSRRKSVAFTFLHPTNSVRGGGAEGTRGLLQSSVTPVKEESGEDDANLEGENSSVQNNTGITVEIITESSAKQELAASSSATPSAPVNPGASGQIGPVEISQVEDSASCATKRKSSSLKRLCGHGINKRDSTFGFLGEKDKDDDGERLIKSSKSCSFIFATGNSGNSPLSFNFAKSKIGPENVSENNVCNNKTGDNGGAAGNGDETFI